MLFMAMIMSANLVFAVTEQQARDYYKNCILNLDPIEGCYAVEFIGQGSKVFIDLNWNISKSWWNKREAALNDVYIVPYNGNFIVCYGNTEEQDWGMYFILERIGETNAYKMFLCDGVDNIHASCHTVLENNGQSFTATFIDGDEQISFNFIKSFPTLSMYENAKQEERIDNYSQGTAFALQDNYFVTNYHVYDKNKFAIVKGLDNKTYRAYYVAGDEANDLAIFQIRDNDFSGFKNVPYSIASSTAEIGEEAWTLGFPLTGILGDEVKYSKGEISSLSGSSSDGDNIKTNDTRFYQITTPITHGNSGGPLFGESGQLIGITSNGWTNLNNVNYAIKSQFLLALLESAGLRPMAPNGKKLYGQSQKDKIRLVKPYIFRVICYNNKDIERDLMDDNLEETLVNESIAKKPCDTIMLHNGKQLLAIIEQVTNDSVIYKGIEQSDDKPQSIEKVLVKAIIYSNGIYENYNVVSTEKEEIVPPMYRAGRTYYYNGKTYIGSSYQDFLLNNCTQAYIQYKTGKRSVVLGSVIGGISAGVLVGGSALAASKKGRAGAVILCAFGAVGTGVGLITIGIGISKQRTAYKVFNEECHNKHESLKKDIQLQMCYNGIGISVSF